MDHRTAAQHSPPLRSSELARERPLPQVRVAGRSDRGQVREQNEDQFLVATLERTIHLEDSTFADDRGRTLSAQPQGRLIMVADGMGGVAGGEVASAVAVGSMSHYATALMPWLVSAPVSEHETLAAGVRDAIARTEESLERTAEERGLPAHMATTLTVAYVTWPELYLIHIGDSRCYRYRGGKLEQLTRDHTVAQELVEAKAMTREQAQRSRQSSILTNAVGGGEPAIPELHEEALERGDRLLLCTDGLTDLLDEDHLARAIEQSDTVDVCAESLVADANEAGGHDNITVVVVAFD